MTSAYGWTDDQLVDIRRKLDPKSERNFTLQAVDRMLGDPRQERRGELFDFSRIIKGLLRAAGVL